MPKNSTPKPPARNILLCHSGSPYNEELYMMGVRRYALHQPAWEMGYILPEEVNGHFNEILKKWRPEGILVVSPANEVPGLLSLTELPVVFVDPAYHCPERVTTVRVDNFTLGRRAAEFFLRKRFKQVAVVSKTRSTPYADIRRAGFLERMREEKIDPLEFGLDSNYSRPWLDLPELDEWLMALPRPIGIFCIRDSFAQQVCIHARRNRLRVPADLSVLGAGNHEVICESVQPRLSSIPVSMVGCGFRAAALLDRLMSEHTADKPSGVFHEKVLPGEVVERQSTSLRAVPDPAIAIAAQYLLDHTLQGGSIKEAVREAGLNRKSLERGFKRHLDTTPGQFMTEVRLDHARRLLSTTDLSMGEIAEACSLTQNHFSYLFRTTLGITPNAYRKRMRQMES